MQATWDLSVFYQDFSDPALRADVVALRTLTSQPPVMLSADQPNLWKLQEVVTALENLFNTLGKAFQFCQLTLAADTENREAFRMLEELSALSVDAQVYQSACTRWIGTLDNLDELIAASPLLQANAFVLREAHREAAHMSRIRVSIRISSSGGTSCNARPQARCMLYNLRPKLLM